MKQKQEAAKKAVGYKAAELIQDGMIVGLGTGSTAFYFIERLITRCKEGLSIKAVASSEKSLQQAQKGGIPIGDINRLKHIDITVDGADEIDPQKRMIKGGGGALVREKIVASMSHELVVIVDESKLVPQLGKAKLPVEVIPFGYSATLNSIEKLGFKGAWRMNADGSLYTTDNQNYIFDIHFDHLCSHPEKDHEALLHIAGVVDTGFFFNLAGRVIVGFFDGQIVVQE
jgi:ribose 5-phosphate isomerase A